MPEEIPRPLIVLAAIVALVAITVGVKDYVSGRREVTVSTSASAPATVQPNPADVKDAKDAKKKTASAPANRTHARQSGSAANATAMSKSGANDFEQPLITDKPANDGDGTAFNDDSANSGEAVTTADETQPRTERKRRGNSENPSLFAAKCVPLPNVTNPGDADYPYYQNWSREYSCLSSR